MRKRFSRLSGTSKILGAAMFGAVVASTAPVLAHGVEHALFAHDAARLNGYGHAALRTIAVPVQGTYVDGNASHTAPGVNLAQNGISLMGLTIIVPPDHKAGAPMYADIVYRELGVAACSWYAEADGFAAPVSGGTADSGWTVAGGAPEGVVDIPSGNATVFRKTLRWLGPSNPGQAVHLRLLRIGDTGGDSCGDIAIMGAQIRY